MEKKILFILVIALFAFSLCSNAQIANGGIPYSFNNELSQDVASVKMPDFNFEKTIENFEKGSKDNEEQIAYGNTFEVNLSLENAGKWEYLENGDRVWRLKVYSQGAMSVNLCYDDFYMPIGGKLFLYNKDGSQVLGAFTNANNKPYGKFSTGLVEGEECILEYYEPANVIGKGIISISKVTHSIKDFFRTYKGFGDSGSCNVNVNCPNTTTYQEVKRSIGMILNGNSRICSGTLINNTNNDGRPYFLTSLHCLDKDFDGALTDFEAAALENWLFVFNYESPECDNVNGPLNQTVSGARLVAYFPESDFLLLELSCAPPPDYNVHFTGWNRAESVPGTQAVIHHPSGDVKKISFNTTGELMGQDFYNLDKETHWFVSEWENGTTEGGSSGCGIFDSNGLYIGNLSGGDASCSATTDGDSFGKFFYAWDTGIQKTQRLKDWLDPSNTGQITLNGIDSPVYELDAAIVLWNIESGRDFCSGSFNPDIEIKNLGTEEVNNVDFSIFVDGEEVQRINKNLIIKSCYDTLITELGDINIGFGEHIIEVQLNSLNGKVDQNVQNNINATEINVIQGDEILVEVLTDDFPTETSFAIFDENGEQLYFVFGMIKASLNTFDYCLGPGCYKFVIYDEYEDGICCGTFGDGYFNITRNGTELLGSGGEFTNADSVLFCIESALIPNFESDIREGCDTVDIQYVDNSVGGATNYSWSFPGGIPEVSTKQNPKVKYVGGGIYDASLTIFNEEDSVTISKPEFIIVYNSPEINAEVIDYDDSTTGSINLMLNNSFDRFEVSWSTGETTQIINDLSPGVYEVTVIDIFSKCSATKSFEVKDLGSGIESFEAIQFNIYPNPASDIVNIKHSTLGFHNIAVYNSHGKLMQNDYFYGTDYAMSLNKNIISGVYFIVIDDGADTSILKLSVIR